MILLLWLIQASLAMISQQLQKLFGALGEVQTDDWRQHEGPRFVTNQITSRVSSFYERLRYVVDYHEEHMLRRAAIERIVRRLLLFSVGKNIGHAILEEMVQARYIDNDTLPEDLAPGVQMIVEKYIRLERSLRGDTSELWSYAAVEIERYLFPSDRDELVFQAMFNTVKQSFAPKESELISEKAFALQVYIACRRVFLRESHAALNYSLFIKMVPEWKTGQGVSDEVIEKVAGNFKAMQNDLHTLTSSRVQWRIAYRLKNEGIYYGIIRELVEKHGREAELIFSDEDRLKHVVEEMLEHTYSAHQSKSKRSGTRAILYILITKIIIGLAVELPYEIFILGEIHYTALIINIAFFPILMILMTKTVAYPGKDNTAQILEGLQGIVSGREQEERFIPVAPRTVVQKLSYFIFFSLFFTLTFGGILYVLLALKFNIASMGLFFLFLCIVTYMGLHIRSKSREWTVEKEDDSFLGLVGYLLLLPVTSSGRWISEKMQSMNIFVFIMDFILETPFKALLGSFDAFISYTKELRRNGV